MPQTFPLDLRLGISVESIDPRDNAVYLCKVLVTIRLFMVEDEFMVFDFDMGRKEYIEKMKKYNMAEDEAIKSDKIYFSRYYGINLDKYTINGRKFIIPYEMSDLFCLMMSVMKSSPIYDKRSTNANSWDMIDHSKTIIKRIDDLPLQIANFVKGSSEYSNAKALVQNLPIIVERISALLHIVLKNGSKENFEKLTDGLDELYERFFWHEEPKCDFMNESEIKVDNPDKLYEYLLWNADPMIRAT